MAVLLSNYERILVRFSFNKTDVLRLPIPENFPAFSPIPENRNGNTGKLVLQEENVNAEYLSDILRGAGLFLRKGFFQVYKGTHPHSATMFYFGKTSRRVRKEKIVRRTLTELLGEAVWAMRVYENPNGASFPLTINFACRQPRFARDGKMLEPKENAALQWVDGELVLKFSTKQQNSAA
jgi:hypothetical protein